MNLQTLDVIVVGDARVAATWTAPRICAHQSALQQGAEVVVPDYGAVIT